MFKLNIYGNPKFERILNRIFKKSGDSIIINNSLEVDNNGDITIGRDLFVEDEIVIDDTSKIVDTDGNPIKIGNGQISSGTATNGQLLTADGNGGASWQSPQGEGHTITITDLGGETIILVYENGTTASINTEGTYNNVVACMSYANMETNTNTSLYQHFSGYQNGIWQGSSGTPLDNTYIFFSDCSIFFGGN